MRRSKKSQSKEDLRRSREELGRSRDDLSEESRSLLDSEDELDREEVLNPESENRSVSAPMRPEPTEYDRLMVNASTQTTTAPLVHPVPRTSSAGWQMDEPNIVVIFLIISW